VFNYILYQMHTGCQWSQLPIAPDPTDPRKKEISISAVYYHYSKWVHDGSFERLWKQSVESVREELDLSVISLDGTHTVGKNGGERVVYNGRKRAKTCNILPIIDDEGYIIASTGLVAGNRHDAFFLKPNLQNAFRDLKQRGFELNGTYFNADAAFDTRAARKVCFNHGLIPNIAPNKRSRKRAKRGRPRLFNAAIYKRRFPKEHVFSWIDKFRALAVRYARLDTVFLGTWHLASALVNLRHLLARNLK
jgi:transposase